MKKGLRLNQHLRVFLQLGEPQTDLMKKGLRRQRVAVGAEELGTTD